VPKRNGDTTVILARHGQTEWNAAGRIQGQGDSPLTSLGREQSLRVSERLAAIEVEAVYASPSERASYLGRLIAARHGHLPVTLVEGLRERSYGCYEGLTREEARARDPALFEKWLADPDREQLAVPGGETQAAMSHRVMAALREIILSHSGGSVAVATHAGPIRSIVFAILGISTTRWGQVLVSPGSLTTICGAPGEPRVVSVNDTSHLDARLLR
jgi:broad specificity phosphatase PhoE